MHEILINMHQLSFVWVWNLATTLAKVCHLFSYIGTGYHGF